ncbi:MAG TPA: hypothetical protein VMP86_02650 [Candidatus Binatia bacterium]|nr:hypothetical protein [Candidatus Binatia bacterium]
MTGRPLAWALIAYGLLGIALLVSGALYGLEMAGRVERLATAADGTLAAAARSIRAAADSFASVDDSLSESEASADEAAALAREASGTLDSLSIAMRISVLGAQPLLPLADEFATSADQAAELAETLDAVGASLGGTRTDVAIIGVELDTLSRELEALRGSGGTDAGSPPLRLFAALLLSWLAIPAIAALLIGLVLLRPVRRVPPAT